jgi:hypothetical protein
MSHREEVKELAERLQNFVFEEADMKQGLDKIFKVITHERCMTIAETLIGQYGYRKVSPSGTDGLVPLSEVELDAIIGPYFASSHNAISLRNTICARFGTTPAKRLTAEGIEKTMNDFYWEYIARNAKVPTHKEYAEAIEKAQGGNV